MLISALIQQSLGTAGENDDDEFADSIIGGDEPEGGIEETEEPKQVKENQQNKRFQFFQEILCTKVSITEDRSY
jgi:hypothetical protein